MIRTPIATTEDIDNATFFASSRLTDLLGGETGLDFADDELDADLLFGEALAPFEAHAID
jgi:hypothetical protein